MEQKAKLVRRLWTPIQASDELAFANELKQLGDLNPIEARNLWATMTGLLADSPIKSAAIELPIAEPVSIPQQSATMFDDTGTAVVKLQTNSNVQDSAIRAHLEVATNDGQSPAKYTLLPQSTSLDPQTRVLTLSFPSLFKWGLGNFESATLYIERQPCSKDLRTDTPLCPSLNVPTTGFPVRLIQPEKAVDPPSPNFKVSTTVTQITSDGGLGTIVLNLKDISDDAVTVTVVSGGEIASVTSDPAGAVLKGQAVSVTGRGDVAVSLKFQNLQIGTPLVLQAEGKKAGKSTGKRSNTFQVQPKGP